MDRDTMTVVFKVKDREAMKAIYDAHLNGTTICGMHPETIAWGDQVDVPSQIVNVLNEMDPDYPNKDELREVCDMATKHMQGR